MFIDTLVGVVPPLNKPLCKQNPAPPNNPLQIPILYKFERQSGTGIISNRAACPRRSTTTARCRKRTATRTIGRGSPATSSIASRQRCSEPSASTTSKRRSRWQRRRCIRWFQPSGIRRGPGFHAVIRTAVRCQPAIRRDTAARCAQPYRRPGRRSRDTRAQPCRNAARPDQFARRPVGSANSTSRMHVHRHQQPTAVWDPAQYLGSPTSGCVPRSICWRRCRSMRRSAWSISAAARGMSLRS